MGSGGEQWATYRLAAGVGIVPLAAPRHAGAQELRACEGGVKRRGAARAGVEIALAGVAVWAANGDSAVRQFSCGHGLAHAPFFFPSQPTSSKDPTSRSLGGAGQLRARGCGRSEAKREVVSPDAQREAWRRRWFHSASATVIEPSKQSKADVTPLSPRFFHVCETGELTSCTAARAPRAGRRPKWAASPLAPPRWRSAHRSRQSGTRGSSPAWASRREVPLYLSLTHIQLDLLAKLG